MAAVWMRFRAEFGSRWRGMLALALLVGLAAGAALAAFAGARRTESAFDRLVTKTEAWHVLVNPDLGTDSDLTLDDLRALPQVARAGGVDGVFATPVGTGGSVQPYDSMVLATDDVVGYEFSRPRMSAGRMPRPGRADEVFVNPRLAEQADVGVGDRLDVVAFSTDDAAVIESGELEYGELVGKIGAGELGKRVPVTVTGIGRMPDEIVVDEGFENSQLLLTRAFMRENPEVGIPYWGAALRLRNGVAGIPQFRDQVEALVPDEAIAFQTLPKTVTKVDRAVRPSVGALTIFGVVIALTGLLVIGQSLARQTFLDSSDNDALRALGTTRGELFAGTMLRTAVVAITGALLGVVVAYLASPLSPIGVAREAEPDPGLRVDGLVLGAGWLATVVVVLGLAFSPAWRAARGSARDRQVARPSRAASAATEMGLSVPAATGVRMALEPGRGRTAVPVRATIVGAGLAIATVVAAAVFASSLDHLVSTPRLFGWNWDTQMSVNAQTGQVVPGTNARDQVVELLNESDAVDRWGTVSLSDVSLDGAPMPAVGIEPESSRALPTLVSGRFPRHNDEVALGRLTENQLHVGIGDTVKARTRDGGNHRLRVVGTVVLPGLGTYPGADKTSLGEGAVLTREELYRLGPNFGRDDFVVKFDASTTPAVRRALVNRAEEIVTRVDPEGFESTGVRRPSDIVAYDRVRSTPLVLALVLGVLASATVAHALVSSIRRRRRDFAMLATLGLTRRQVSSSVAWQSTTVGVCALLIGVPLGIIGGRWAWSLLADDLGTVSEPRIPLLALLLGIPVVLLLCNAVAYLPGRAAARLRPAAVLRSE
jgi:ABC-type lipoprotein release transport system permease subunit